MKGEEGEGVTIWKEGLSCHLVAVSGTTLSSLAGEGNRRFLAEPWLFESEIRQHHSRLEWRAVGMGPPTGARLLASSDVCAP